MTAWTDVRPNIRRTVVRMYDMTRLNALGKRRQRLMEQLEALRIEIEPEIRAAAQAGVPQVDIVRATGYTRETVRVASMAPEERQAERAKRRKAKG